MKITSISPSSSVNGVSEGVVKTPSSKKKVNFGEILNSFKDDPHKEILKLRDSILNGATFTPQEILRYQILVGNFGLKVELVSRVADGVLTAVKKLQNQ